MSEHDHLRRVFDDLAAGPPAALGRKEAVMSRVNRRLQRQALVRGAGVVALAVALGAGAVQTTLNLRETGSEGSESVVVTTTTPTQEPTHATSSSEPSHAPSRAAEPTHSAQPSRAPEPTAVPAAEPTHGVEPTHATTPAPEDTAASGPLTVAVEMSPSTVDTAHDTRALVTARDGEGRLLAVDITWGDGTTFHFSPPDTACPRTTHLDGSFNHRYGAPGSYVVHVTITSGDCAATEKVTREAHVTVTGGAEPTASPEPSSSNGPAQPTAGADGRTGDNPEYVYLNAKGADSDGWVRRITVDWGDGTTTTAGEWGTTGCSNAAGTDHPSATHHDGNVSHRYAESGAHTVTITSTSVACDGTHEQTGTATRSVTAP